MARTDDYDFRLPRELIAQQPLARRTDARLMVVRRDHGTWEHAHVRDLADLLDARDTLVLNDTRVIPARLIGRRTRTGGRWEGLFLSANEQGAWHVLGRTRGRLELGESIALEDIESRSGLELLLLTRLPDGSLVVRPRDEAPWQELLERWGRVPLPPYIRGGEMTLADREQYQTVFAERPGAVAAPTAGLHFTEDLLGRLHVRGIDVCRVTLHVGLGTFRPIGSEHVEEHRMHAEWGQIEPETVETIRKRREAGGRTVAVGTTTVRVLETAAQDGALRPWRGETDLFIRPPYTFRAIDGMLTNFHVPRSTLLVLVRTFGGDALMREAYAEAVRERYRFFSYGDAMLIL